MIKLDSVSEQTEREDSGKAMFSTAITAECILTGLWRIIRLVFR